MVQETQRVEMGTNDVPFEQVSHSDYLQQEIPNTTQKILQRIGYGAIVTMAILFMISVGIMAYVGSPFVPFAIAMGLVLAVLMLGFAMSEEHSFKNICRTALVGSLCFLAGFYLFFSMDTYPISAIVQTCVPASFGIVALVLFSVLFAD